MKRSFPVIDADGHVIERDRELREFCRRRIAVWQARVSALFLGWLGAGRTIAAQARTS